MSNHQSFAPPVESRVLGSVTTPSGASPVAGHPDCVPVTMSGDAWEAAANHVIMLREKSSPNADIWHQIGSFLQDLCKRPEPCLFPQPEYIPPASSGMTGYVRWIRDLREDFWFDQFVHGSIDAPQFLPRGSVDCFNLDSRAAGFCTDLCRCKPPLMPRESEHWGLLLALH